MKIFNALKFILIFLFDLAKNNVAKTIFISIMTVSYIYMGTFPNNREEYRIVKQDKIENTFIYIYPTVSDNKVSFGILSSTEPLKLENNKYVFYTEHGANVFFYIIFGISAFIFLIMTIGALMGENEAQWDFGDSLKYTFSRFINCEEENGKFYYTLFGRLVSVKDSIIESSRHDRSYRQSLMYQLNIVGSFSELSAFPKYKTKKNKRSELLEKMGI